MILTEVTLETVGLEDVIEKIDGLGEIVSALGDQKECNPHGMYLVSEILRQCSDELKTLRWEMSKE